MLDIHTIGAGGGSIAYIDRGGALRVGPASSGASPGPACYGLGGTEPTVTDANLVLGRLGPGSRLGEGNPLDHEAAVRAIYDRIAKPLDITVEKAAEGIITVVNAGMSRALRLISVQRGYDPGKRVYPASWYPAIQAFLRLWAFFSQMPAGTIRQLW